MKDEPGNEGPERNGLNPPFSGSKDGDGGHADPSMDRLPPPMFPAGARHRAPRPEPAAAFPDEGGGIREDAGGIPEDAFILPEDPIVRPEDGEVFENAFEPVEVAWSARQSSFDSALIDPDAPIVRREPPRTPADYESVLRGAAAPQLDEGVVTGIGDDTHEDDREELGRLGVSDREPDVEELIRAVKRLADALGSRGEAGLRTTADMTRFEATLRAYCVGYLTRAREERE
jgi:hypothetical protein